MLEVFQRFDKHCSFHLQGGCFWLGILGGVRYKEQAIGEEWNVRDLIFYCSSPVFVSNVLVPVEQHPTSLSHKLYI
jgi:hypothetical protein